MPTAPVSPFPFRPLVFDEVGFARPLRRVMTLMGVAMGLHTVALLALVFYLQQRLVAIGHGPRLGIDSVLIGLAVLCLVVGSVLVSRLRRLLRTIGDHYGQGLTLARQQATQLRVTLRSIGDAVVATNALGEVVFLNPVAEQLMGWSSAEAEGRPLSEVFLIFNEQTGAPAENPVAHVLRERTVMGLANHTFIRSRTGFETPIEDSAAPILDDDGQITGVILVFHDVGVKREIERRMQEAEWRSSMALELGGAGAWVWDATQDRVTGDVMLARTFGIPLAKCLTGEKASVFLAAIHERDRARVETTIRRAIETGGSYEAEFSVRNAAGESSWVQARGRVDTGFQSGSTRLLGFLIDITEQRRAAEALRESEQRFRLLNRVGESTRSLTDPKEIMAAVSRLLGEHLAVSRCAYADVEAGGEQFRIQDDFTSGCATTVGDYELSLFGSQAVEAMHTGRTLVISDLGADLSDEAGAGAFRAIDIQAIVCCPLIRDGVLRAMMAVHQTVPRCWTDTEIALVEEVAERSWATIERARAEAALHERVKFAAMRADISAQVTSSDTLDGILQACCELLVRHLDLSFARVWTVNSAEPVLDLRASAGLYTHLNGPHGKVPIGQFKIGRIALNQEPLMTNRVADDPNISSPDWAKREGMVAFAGYPLLTEQRTVGVLAMFSKNALSATLLEDLLPIADTLALCIERKRAELELRAATERAEQESRAVAESAMRFRLLAEVVSLQVWTACLDGQLDFANQECVQYLPARDLERDVLGSAWAQYVHPDDLPAALRSWEASLASGERYEVEFRLRGRDGFYRWFLVRAEAMRDETGAVAKWFGTNTDIHDLKTAQGAAEQANRSKDEFLAALSHELRTPLTPVLMTAAALCEDASLPLPVREALRMMERNIALEARLIDDLLDLTRISRGKLEIRAQPCDAHSLISMAVEIILDDALQKSISIQRDFGAKRSGLIADPTRFQQVIWNLLRNAVKFTPRGGRIAIGTRDVACADGSPGLRIEVIDSGIGITPEQLEKIFLPFEQGGLTGNHRFGGIGLGLAIARAIVDLHGGSVSAQSEGANRGATFIVELPGAMEPPLGAIDDSEPLLPTFQSHSPTARISARLLLVEDHEATLQVMARLLRRAGYEVTPAGSIADALFAAATNEFDLVISDLGLPDGTGTELMQQLRDKYGLKGIALSGYGMEEDLARSREAGFVTHLTKPVDFHQLEVALRAIPEIANPEKQP